MEPILLDKVREVVEENDLSIEVHACDPKFADTAQFNEKYGFTPEQAANTIIVTSKKIEPAVYAACVVLGSDRLDVNKKVKKLLGVQRASFADSIVTRDLTGMEIGGVVAVGIDAMPIFVDEQVMQQPKVIMGGGNRTSKLIINPKELLKLPNTLVADIALREEL